MIFAAFFMLRLLGFAEARKRKALFWGSWRSQDVATIVPEVGQGLWRGRKAKGSGDDVRGEGANHQAPTTPKPTWSIS